MSDSELAKIKGLAEEIDANEMVPAGFFAPTVVRLCDRLERSEAALRTLRQASAWIPAIEKPEPGSVVMVYGYDVSDNEKLKYMDIATYSYHGGWNVGIERADEMAIMFWRPLPEAPNDLAAEGGK